MEFRINILDSFPSLNKIQQKNNLFLEFNNKEYSLNKLINQQETIISKKSTLKLYFKIYFSYYNKKILIGINYINQDLIKFDNNKCFITWIEFRKKSQYNHKDINDINFLFFDCLRLKIKISLIKSLPKTDKRIKKSKNKIKLGAKTPIIPKKENINFIFKNNDINIRNDDDNLDSYRNIETNLLKSKSQEENVKINNEELDNQKVETNSNLNKIIEKYDYLRLKSEESISHEVKNLLIENDCLLTDNNLFDNYSYSISLGDNNIKNKNKIDKENNKIIKNDNINYNYAPKNYFISINNFKSMNKQDKINNTSYNEENTENKKIEFMKSDIKNLNKLTKSNNNDKKHEKKFKKLKTNNEMNKSNSIKAHNLLSEKIYFNSNTYNNFYKKNKINEEYNHFETNVNNDKNNDFSNNLLISNNIDPNKKSLIYVDKTNEFREYEEFISMKKDYDLLYTPAFIKEIKKDLLDLEINIALEKSISLFLLYNSHISLFEKQKNDNFNKIKYYEDKIEILNKKIDLLNKFKRKNEIKEKNQKILKESNSINFKNNYLAQKNIFESLSNNKMNSKIILKSIINILVKRNPDILANINQNQKSVKQNESINNNDTNSYNKCSVKSPIKCSKKFKIKSPQIIKQKQKYEFMSEIKNKNSLFNNKLYHKKKASNKNLKKNKSINYIVSLENIHERDSEKPNCKDIKENFSKNNLVYYSTAKNKFYNSNIEKGK